MKKIHQTVCKISGILCLFLLQCQLLPAQKISLDGNWKYSLKDDAAFSSPGLNDKEWKEKPAGSLLFKQEELDPASKYAWMRKSFVIPSSFLQQSAQTGALSLFLGRIYQSDEMYFNGQLMGKTNSSDIKRIYIIDPKMIYPDKENVIALRIRHWGDKAGLETTQPYLGAAPASSVFVLSSSAAGVQNKQQVKGRQAIYNCIVVNHAAKAASGEVHAIFYDAAAKKLVDFKKAVTLSPGTDTVSFSYKSPSSFLKIHYTLTIPQYAYAGSWNDEFGYNGIDYIAAIPVINDKVKAHFVPADLQQQVIKGWLGERLAANEEKRLYQVDEQAILAGYINRPGDHPWIGEHVGKFLDAASNTYKNTGDAAIKTQIDRTAQQLIAAQLDNGYLGTYTPENYWTSWDVWSHKYDIIGLLSYYSLSGYKPALDAAKKAGDLLCTTFGYGKGQLDIIQAGSHVGMAATSVLEPIVDLYRYTGEKKYLDFCYYLVKSFDQQNGPKIISTLDATGRVDKTANAKAYEMLSNLLGLIKLYKLTGEDRFLKPVLLAWKDIVDKRLYITGTASSFEHFKDDGELPASDKDNMGEGCVTTTWLQLNYQLLCIYGNMKYVNELERSVYNHLTGAENPQSGCVSYYTPLVGVKPYRCVITCCMSSVPRGIAMIPLFANGKIDDKPSFLFYQPGTYSTTVAGNVAVSFHTVTNFPADGSISITVDPDKAMKFPVEFRKPYWAAGFSLSVNGTKQVVNNDETIVVTRTWNKGDKIAVSFSMPVMVLEGGRSYPGYIAFQRGPQVLAFDNSLNTFSAESVSVDPANVQLQPALSVLSGKWVGAEAFELKTAAGNAEKNVILVPYADASQTGGSITTWIKKEAGK